MTAKTPDFFYLWPRVWPLRHQIFFISGHVYENHPQSIAELKVAITQKIYAIRKGECVRVIDNFACRFQVEHVL